MEVSTLTHFKLLSVTVFLLILSLFTAVTASEPSTHWFLVLDFPGRDEALGIAPAPGGGVYVVGRTEAYGDNTDAFIARVNNDGTIVWFKLLGGSGVDYAEAVSSHDGFAYVIGMTYSYGSGNGDVFVAKISPSGDLLDFYVVIVDGWQDPQDAYVDSEGNIYVTGLHRPPGGGDDAFLLKLSSDYGVDWFLSFSGPGQEMGFAVYSSGSNAYVAGFTDAEGAGFQDQMTISVSSDGSVQWIVLVGTDGSDMAMSVTKGPGDYIYVAGEASISHLQGVYYRISSDGVVDTNYMYTIFLTNNRGERGRMVFTPDNSLYFVETSSLGKNDRSPLMVHIDVQPPSGFNRYPSVLVDAPSTDIVRGVILGEDNLIYVAGTDYPSGTTDAFVYMYSPTIGDVMNWVVGGESWADIEVTADTQYVTDASPILTITNPTSISISYVEAESYSGNPSYTDLPNPSYSLATDTNTPLPIPEPAIVWAITLTAVAAYLIIRNRKGGY